MGEAPHTASLPPHLPLLALPCPLPPLSLPRPHPSSSALFFAAPLAALTPDSPETRVTTPQRMPPRTSARGAAGLGPLAFRPRRPSAPPAPAPRTRARPAVAAQPPLTAIGLTSAQACGTSFCIHVIECGFPALPSRPSSTRAPHLAVSSVPQFARPTCAVLLACRVLAAPRRLPRLSVLLTPPSLPLGTYLTVSPLSSHLLLCSKVKACAPRVLLAAPSSYLASSAPCS